MRTLLVRQFELAVDPATAWERLADVERWPTWAHHIRAVELTPPGALTPTSEGRIRLTNGMRPRFRMTRWSPGRGWSWSGRFLWLRVAYDHRFEAATGGRTRVTFEVSAEGLGVSTLGRFFARVYAKSLDRAIPNLVSQLAAPPPVR